VTEACEYCNREDGTLYAWHGDTWCRDCIEAHPQLAMTGSLDDAPVGRPVDATYSQPFIIQVGT